MDEQYQNIRANVGGRKKFKVAIVGGGVCGLTCAIALSRWGAENLDVDVYEAAPEFSEVGAGIGLGPNSIRILQEIGVLDVLVNSSQENCVDNQWFRYRSGMEGHEVIYDYPLRGEDSVMSIHRASLLNALVDSLPPHLTHFNKRCTRISELPSSASSSSTLLPPPPLRIDFSDGTSATADLIIGADGIKSIVRANIIRADPTSSIAFSNCVAYRGLVPMEEVKGLNLTTNFEERPCLFVGKDKHVVVYPIKGGQLVNVVACVRDRSVPLQPCQPDPWSTIPHSSHSQSLQDEYQHWGEDVTKLLSCIKEPSKWMMHVVHPHLESYVRGRVGLIGDSAHAMLPHLSAGAGQGVEDAYVLAKLLCHPQANIYNLEAILQIYDTIRRPRVTKIWDGSLAAGNSYEGYGKNGYSVEGVKKDLEGIWDYVWYYDLGKDVGRGERLLERIGVFSGVRL